MKTILTVITITIFVSGCASFVDINKDRFNAMPQHYSQFDMKMAWQTKTSESNTVIDGMVKMYAILR